MPPIEKAPNSFYAVPGTAEAVELHADMLNNGRFEKLIDVTVEDLNAQDRRVFWLFQHEGDDAVDAFEYFGSGGTYVTDEWVRMERPKPLIKRLLGKIAI